MPLDNNSINNNININNNNIRNNKKFMHEEIQNYGIDDKKDNSLIIIENN